MSVTIAFGAEWGDEGKGKGSHYLSHPDRCDVSVRALGGGNAGHTIIANSRKYALHLLPAGCLYPETELVLGRGMVTHLPTLMKEIQEMQEGVNPDILQYLTIARENHILLEGHKLVDAEMERRRGNDAIGTTKSGIGPAYSDKALRVGMRMESLELPDDRLKDEYLKLARHWEASYGINMNDTSDKDVTALLAAKEMLEDNVERNMTNFWRSMFRQHARIVIEGAQGYELNIDNGGYPHVTSSAISIDGHMHGAQISSSRLTRRIGFMKAYTTRVGNGTMLTELSEEDARIIQEKGGERGATTGRLRRVGWSDLIRLNDVAFNEGIDEWAMMKIDIFDGRETIPVCVGHNKGKPVYEYLPGWSESTKGITEFKDLPKNAQNYIEFFHNETDVPVTLIGTGPSEEEMIERSAN